MAPGVRFERSPGPSPRSSSAHDTFCNDRVALEETHRTSAKPVDVQEVELKRAFENDSTYCLCSYSECLQERYGSIPAGAAPVMQEQDCECHVEFLSPGDCSSCRLASNSKQQNSPGDFSPNGFASHDRSAPAGENNIDFENDTSSVVSFMSGDFVKAGNGQRGSDSVSEHLPPKRTYQRNSAGNIIDCHRKLSGIVPFWKHLILKNKQYAQPILLCLGSTTRCKWWLRKYNDEELLDFARRGHDVGLVSASVIHRLDLSLPQRLVFNRYQNNQGYSVSRTSFPWYAYVQSDTISYVGNDDSPVTHFEFIPLTRTRTKGLEPQLLKYYNSNSEGFLKIELDSQSNDWTISLCGSGELG